MITDEYNDLDIAPPLTSHTFICNHYPIGPTERHVAAADAASAAPCCWSEVDDPLGAELVRKAEAGEHVAVCQILNSRYSEGRGKERQGITRMFVGFSGTG